MTDQLESAGARVRTGVAAVDDVLADVEGLESRELSDHIEVFAQVHARLRALLDDASLDAPEPDAPERA